jgi:hypothetical protein
MGGIKEGMRERESPGRWRVVVRVRGDHPVTTSLSHWWRLERSRAGDEGRDGHLAVAVAAGRATLLLGVAASGAHRALESTGDSEAVRTGADAATAVAEVRAAAGGGRGAARARDALRAGARRHRRGRVAGDGLERAGNEEALEASSLLALAAEPVPGEVTLLRRGGACGGDRGVVGLVAGGLVRGAVADLLVGVEAGAEERLGRGRAGGRLDVLGENVLARGAEGGDGAVFLGALAEDEADEHVQAADGEEEEGRDEGEVVDVVGEDGRANEALEHAERAEAKGGAEDGEVAVEEATDERRGELGHEEDDGLKEDEETVEHGPEYAGGLVRDSAVLDVVAVRKGLGLGRALEGHEVVDGADVVDHHEDGAREDEQEPDDAESADSIEEDEEVWVEQVR